MEEIGRRKKGLLVGCVGCVGEEVKGQGWLDWRKKERKIKDEK